MRTSLAVLPPTSAITVMGLHTLEEETLIYLAYKQKRLTPASQRGYRSTLQEFVRFFFNRELDDFEPPNGAGLIEEFLTLGWGNKAPRTYNKHIIDHGMPLEFFQQRRGGVAA